MLLLVSKNWFIKVDTYVPISPISSGVFTARRIELLIPSFIKKEKEKKKYTREIVRERNRSVNRVVVEPTIRSPNYISLVRE